MQGFFGFNPNAIIFMIFTTCSTILCGGSLILGLAIGSGIIVTSSIIDRYIKI